ncbi:hypothetical protein [Haladaptatus sp. CMAA 1911]|uniref:hypothetical protein n=1 Tax=unclassified Haladaptatus TaxID=2622732 RepID=UPI0037546C54
MTEIGDHYRPAGEPSDSNVYRVVGREEEVTMLRVTDTDGDRVNSGEIRRCSVAELDAEFEPAKNPDSRFSPVSSAKNMLSGLYWSFRRFL